MNLVSPNGTIIAGTLERLHARAGIIPGSARRNPQGGIEFDHDGETELFWEDQRTVLRDEERVFLDEEGWEFLESQLRLIPADAVGTPPIPHREGAA